MRCHSSLAAMTIAGANQMIIEIGSICYTARTMGLGVPRYFRTRSRFGCYAASQQARRIAVQNCRSAREKGRASCWAQRNLERFGCGDRHGLTNQALGPVYSD